jgi:hypothetical protein
VALVRDWQALLVTAACLGLVSLLFFCSSWQAGYDAGTLRVSEVHDVKSWGQCADGWGRWVRCARLQDGSLLVVRGMR